jgi:2-polyprenyl-3-methyl-5-hydroxy-6-metoxy-1,4-benzoquinol methylase
MSELEQANIDRFNGIAAEWDEEPARIEMAEAVATAMLAALAPSGAEQALEFGCGTGLVTLRLAARVAQVTAMDSSAQMLDVLRRKCERNGVSNVTPRQGSVPGQLPEATFDCIVSSMTLHHVEDVNGLFLALLGHLVPGGRIALADLDAEDGSFHGDKTGIAHHGFDRDTVRQGLRNAWFESIEFSTAHVAQREDAEGAPRDYSIFLFVATRPGA